MNRIFTIRTMWIVLFYFTSCTTPKPILKPVEFNSINVSLIPMKGEFVNDSLFLAFIKPYRDSLQVQMSTKIGETKVDLKRSKPESNLGNSIAESVRDYASMWKQTHIDIGIVNIGGLRTDLSSGDITIGSVYELMPFENKLILLEVSGLELQSILDDISIAGGEPISGARFRMENGKAKDVIISGQPINFSQTYTIATSDYLVNGGGVIKSFWTVKNKTETNVLIRDVIIEYIKTRRILESRVDGRVRI